jgi:hypothetical protein
VAKAGACLRSSIRSFAWATTLSPNRPPSRRSSRRKERARPVGVRAVARRRVPLPEWGRCDRPRLSRWVGVVGKVGHRPAPWVARQRMLRAHLCGRLDAKRPLLPGDGDASAEGQVARESRLSSLTLTWSPGRRYGICSLALFFRQHWVCFRLTYWNGQRPRAHTSTELAYPPIHNASPRSVRRSCRAEISRAFSLLVRKSPPHAQPVTSRVVFHC